MATLTVANFGNPVVNGTYTDSGSKDGQTRYVKNGNSDMVIEYREEFGPYSFTNTYYMILTHQIQGAVPVEDPLYKVLGSDPTASGWATMQDQSVGSSYNSTGTVS
jgi:hypothetical protein